MSLYQLHRQDEALQALRRLREFMSDPAKADNETRALLAEAEALIAPVPPPQIGQGPADTLSTRPASRAS